VACRPLLVEGVAEHAPRRPLPPRGDAHAVELLVQCAFTGSGLAGDHACEMEPEHLATGLREVVVCNDAGRLACRQPGLRLRLSLDGIGRDVGRGSGGNRRLLAEDRFHRALELG